MGLMDWFRGKAVSVTNGIFGITSTYDSGETEEVADVFTCIKILSENTSKMTPQVRDKNNKITDHKLNRVLGWKPNAFQNHQSFWQTVEYTRNVYGNAYVYLQRDPNGYINKMYALRNDSILSATITESGKLIYRVNFSTSLSCPRNDTTDVSAENIFHFRHQSKDGIFGISPLTVLRSYASILSRASQMLESFYGNNAMSTLALKPKIDKQSLAETMQKASDDFIKNHGSSQSGKIITIPPNTDLVEINQKYADAQVIETQRYSKEQIGNLFGIPKFMLGITDTDKSIEQQTKQFLALTLSPILQMYSAEMEFKSIRDDEHKKGLYIGYNTEKMIETDTKTKAETIANLVSKGLMTPNEGAVAMGNDPIDGIWGNLHWIQSQNNPIEYYDEWGKTNNNNKDGTDTKDKSLEDRGGEVGQ